ncbi:MAG TPA: SPOR domain-containing protein [Gemmatimonadaceae bacterium]|nr:SPOR domain-containing protein [Gemmatimonadaceae bacterium]
MRAQRMVTAGQDSAGRAVVDSVLRATDAGTPRYAEALFWRATFSRTAAAAERDYRQIAVEYPLSPRAQEALFRLAQLETTRGDRASARAHLTRIQREHPYGSMSARANVMLAQLSFGDGDIVAGCAAVSAARETLTAADVELRNQLDYYTPRCANLAATGAVGDTTIAAARTTGTSTKARQEYSVQAAAFVTRDSAEVLAKRLSTRGYNVRIVGTSKPFRVRVGRYPTRDRAAEVLRELTQVNVKGMIVEAERP